MDKTKEYSNQLRRRTFVPHGAERYEEATGQPLDPGYSPPPAERSPQGIGNRPLNAQEALESGDAKLREALKRRMQK